MVMIMENDGFAQKKRMFVLPAQQDGGVDWLKVLCNVRHCKKNLTKKYKRHYDFLFLVVVFLVVRVFFVEVPSEMIFLHAVKSSVAGSLPLGIL